MILDVVADRDGRVRQHALDARSEYSLCFFILPAGTFLAPHTIWEL